MKKTAFISDLLFCFLTSLLFFLCLFRYHRYPMALAFFCGLLCASLITFLAYIPLNKKRKRKVSEGKQREQRDRLMLYLSLLPKQKQAEFFLPIFENARMQSLDGMPVIETEETLIFPLFTIRPFDGDATASILRLETDKKKLLLCNVLSPEAEELCAQFSLEYKTRDQVFFLAEEKGLLPDLSWAKQPPKTKEKIRLFLKKSNHRPFFVGSLLLLFSSLITPFPFYYLFLGGTMLTLSILVRFLGTEG